MGGAVMLCLGFVVTLLFCFLFCLAVLHEWSWVVGVYGVGNGGWRGGPLLWGEVPPARRVTLQRQPAGSGIS